MERTPDLMAFRTEVIHPEGNTGYLTSALRAGVWAVRETMNSDFAKGVHGYSSLPVEMEAPIEAESYPYVQVMYRNKGFEHLTVQEARLVEWVDTDGALHEGKLHAYRFSGSYALGVYSTSILERERVSDCLIGLVGIDDAFPRLLTSNRWINVSANMATLASTTASESFGTPWDEDLMTAYRQFEFDVRGEFYYAVGREVQYIERIHVDAKVQSGL